MSDLIRERVRDSGQKSAPKFHKYHKGMGSGRDKRKKARPKAPGAGADKTVRKTEKNADKAVKRATKAAQVIRSASRVPLVCVCTSSPLFTMTQDLTCNRNLKHRVQTLDMP